MEICAKSSRNHVFDVFAVVVIVIAVGRQQYAKSKRNEW